MTPRIIDLFAGPGGMSEGLVIAGYAHEDILGVEWDQAACDTARAAGHPRLMADVSLLDPADFGTPEGLHASPSCQGFSVAGLGKGRGDVTMLAQAVEVMGGGEDPDRVTKLAQRMAADERSTLTLEPLRWALRLRPEWVTLEQVLTVLPLWRIMGEALERHGYSVWTGYAHSEQHGVAQTRKRAILLASRIHEVSPLVATHSRYHVRTPDRLDDGVLPWVSMAEALGIDPALVMRSNYSHGGDLAYRGMRPATSPAFTVTSKADRNRWVLQPGTDEHPAQKITIEEAGALQSFSADYPWRGTKTKKFEQVGNAVPPLLGAAMVGGLLTKPLTSGGDE